MVKCSKCGRDLDQQAAASISGSIMGDPYINSYYLCPSCNFYTLEITRDRWLEEAEVSVRGPISRAEGEAIVEQIRRCPDPGNKNCRCDVHQKYFGSDVD